MNLCHRLCCQFRTATSKLLSRTRCCRGPWPMSTWATNVLENRAGFTAPTSGCSSTRAPHYTAVEIDQVMAERAARIPTVTHAQIISRRRPPTPALPAEEFSSVVCFTMAAPHPDAGVGRIRCSPPKCFRVAAAPAAYSPAATQRGVDPCFRMLHFSRTPATRVNPQTFPAAVCAPAGFFTTCMFDGNGAQTALGAPSRPTSGRPRPATRGHRRSMRNKPYQRTMGAGCARNGTRGSNPVNRPQYWPGRHSPSPSPAWRRAHALDPWRAMVRRVEVINLGGRHFHHYNLGNRIAGDCGRGGACADRKNNGATPVAGRRFRSGERDDCRRVGGCCSILRTSTGRPRVAKSVRLRDRSHRRVRDDHRRHAVMAARAARAAEPLAAATKSSRIATCTPSADSAHRRSARRTRSWWPGFPRRSGPRWVFAQSAPLRRHRPSRR